MSSMWLLIGALATFAVAYRFYGAFLAAKVAMLSDERMTPAHRLKDGVDYHPISRYVLFGQHFAAIAGPGPLVGPVLAAQWGFLPGYLWIVVGACLAGGVHDFIVLWASVREDGLSISKLARTHLGPVSGLITSVATLVIVIAILSSIGLVVVNILDKSPWGTFTITVTIPAALLTGLWMYRIRPGRITEASVVGVTIVLLGVFLGRPFAEGPWGHLLMFEKDTLKLLLPVYAAIASILPVWLLMCPRDYLSSYLKVGVIVVLAAGMCIAPPELKMPATTCFTAGGGPNNSGAVWPFVCIVIMCGALSGFHALIGSGTTPKMVNRESDIRPIGYGAMLVEGFVAITALIAACALEPGDYFAINIPQDNDAQRAAYVHFQEKALAEHAWNLQPRELEALEAGTGEQLAGRTGGAVTLAVGMAKVFRELPGMKQIMAYWYHFIIMFEALFILTLLETGTRVSRFVLQETMSQFGFRSSPTGRVNWTANIVSSVATCGAWGYLLYVGNISTLWRMLGIANQLLAAIALAIATTYILTHAAKRRYAWCTVLPFVGVLVTVDTAAVLSIRDWWAEIATAAPGQVFFLRLMCIMAGILLLLTTLVTVDAVRKWWQILGSPAVPSVPLTAQAAYQTRTTGSDS